MKEKSRNKLMCTSSISLTNVQVSFTSIHAAKLLCTSITGLVMGCASIAVAFFILVCLPRIVLSVSKPPILYMQEAFLHFIIAVHYYYRKSERAVDFQ